MLGRSNSSPRSDSTPALKGSGAYRVRRGERGEAFRLSFTEFLAGALLFAAGTIVLGGLAYALDRIRPAWLEPVHDFLAGHFFRSTDASSSLLETIASTVITVASITFSLLLVAVQQSASSFTAQVFDQFLRRRTNQFYLGFFVGLGMSALLQAATVHEDFNPVYGTTLTLLLTVVAVALLLVLVYSAINQMRPVVIVEAIHDHLIEARLRQVRTIVARTRRRPQLEVNTSSVVRSHRTGFVMRIDVDAIQGAINRSSRPCEVVLEVSIGTFVGYGDPLAYVKTEDTDAQRRVAAIVDTAIHRERQARIVNFIDAHSGLAVMISRRPARPSASRFLGC